MEVLVASADTAAGGHTDPCLEHFARALATSCANSWVAAPLDASVEDTGLEHFVPDWTAQEGTDPGCIVLEDMAPERIALEGTAYHSAEA